MKTKKVLTREQMVQWAIGGGALGFILSVVALFALPFVRCLVCADPSLGGTIIVLAALVYWLCGSLVIKVIESYDKRDLDHFARKYRGWSPFLMGLGAPLVAAWMILTIKRL
jgi:hypothetical protein